ncbi:DUF4783 domain-containing protein [Sphingobacterium paludis]|uniref:Uncharacterized protein DUF4783 n=1 Tax=Sphingobacterium paludis TaxID=1476465 RepID=A0A4R7CZ02_9SPHI|nr:DUF4783 domain-containing protein [Sphingobacterium paludis]TDS12394.1 uncharacterized protein DUF4783 [Sphingobacterium paludis]
MKRTLTVILCCVSLLVHASAPWFVGFDELVEEVASALKVGHAKKLSNTFANSLTLSVKREDGTYTKFQAELLLEDFFRSNKVEHLKELQRVNNSSNSYIVFSLKTNKSTYRVFIKLSNNNKQFQVVEMRIE